MNSKIGDIAIRESVWSGWHLSKFNTNANGPIPIKQGMIID